MTLSIPESGYEACIFDCDGTLIDSMPLHYEAWCHALRLHGFEHPFPPERHYGNAGKPIPATVHELNTEFGLEMDAESIEAVRNEFVLAHHDRLRAIEPVVDFALRLAGVMPMAVASGSQRVVVDRSLQHLGIAHLFPVIVTPEDVAPGRGKPAPDMFLLAASRMGVPPAGCLVFEDGQSGIEAAMAAGMQTVFVPSPAAAH